MESGPASCFGISRRNAHHTYKIGVECPKERRAWWGALSGNIGSYSEFLRRRLGPPSDEDLLDIERPYGGLPTERRNQLQHEEWAATCQMFALEVGKCPAHCSNAASELSSTIFLER